jgi:hypothetical protein
LPVEPFSDVFIEFSCAWRYANARTGKLQFQLRQDRRTSIRNPRSAIGDTPFATGEQNKMLEQAKKYSAAFDEVIYHTNSAELIIHYSKVFREAGITNFRIVWTR